MRSAPSSSAVSRTASAGSPSRKIVRTFDSDPSELSACWRISWAADLIASGSTGAAYIPPPAPDEVVFAPCRTMSSAPCSRASSPAWRTASAAVSDPSVPTRIFAYIADGNASRSARSAGNAGAEAGAACLAKENDVNVVSAGGGPVRRRHREHGPVGPDRVPDVVEEVAVVPEAGNAAQDPRHA